LSAYIFVNCFSR